jgi:hypothetical protein
MERLEEEKMVMKGGRMVRPGERQPKLSTTVPCFAYKRKRVDSNDDGGSTASRKTLTIWYLCGEQNHLLSLLLYILYLFKDQVLS